MEGLAETPRDMRPWLQVLSALVLGIALVVTAIITTQSIDYIKTFNTSLLNVTGEAQMDVTSNQVKWTGNFFVNAQPTQLQPAYAQMKKDAAAVNSFLTGKGVPAADITISPVSMNQIFANCAQQPGICGKFNIAGYRLSQMVTVQSSNVQGITKIASDTTPLIDQGVSFSTQNLAYYYTKLASLRAKMIAEATSEAQARAKQIAAATGRQIGQLVSVREEPLQLTSLNSPSVSNGGQYSTSTIQKQLTAIVQAQFRLPQ